MRRVIPLSLVAVTVSLAAHSNQAGEWGDLKGRFVYDGEPPVRKPIQITADEQYCGRHNLLEEQLVVNRGNNGAANIIVWLLLRRGQPIPPVHESYAKVETAEVKLDSTKCRIDPHVRLLRTTQTLLMRNTDPIGDGLKIDTFSNPAINVLLAPGGELRHQFPAPERLPARVSCPVHPWESGWLLVKEHPYMAASDEDGGFEIKSLPAGKWTFQFWHEKSGYVSEVKLHGKPVTWPRGRLEIEIEPGGNNLGEVKLPPTLFEK
jgi:hypothetical protein